MFFFPARIAACVALLLALAASLPAAAQEDLSSMVQEQYEDFMFPAPARYGITGQMRLVTPVPIAVQEEEGGPITEITVTGNVVDSYYLYLRDDDKHLNRIEVVSHYERAMRPYHPETLFRDEYHYYGRFTRDDKQYYIVIHVASKGAEYEIIIVEALI